MVMAIPARIHTCPHVRAVFRTVTHNWCCWPAKLSHASPTFPSRSTRASAQFLRDRLDRLERELQQEKEYRLKVRQPDWTVIREHGFVKHTEQLDAHR